MIIRQRNLQPLHRQHLVFGHNVVADPLHQIEGIDAADLGYRHQYRRPAVGRGQMARCIHPASNHRHAIQGDAMSRAGQAQREIAHGGGVG